MKYVLCFLFFIRFIPLAYGDGVIRNDSNKMMTPKYTVDTTGVYNTKIDKMDLFLQGNQLQAMKDVIKGQQSEINEIKARLDNIDKKINSEGK